MATYFCEVSSNGSLGRVYTVNTTSAMRCSQLIGRYEDGETITVRRKRSGVALSEVRYSPELHGYYRCTIAERRI